MLSDTMTRAPLFSRISFTCFPPLPMMIDASCVTMRQRICIMAEGAVDPEVEAAADVVADPEGEVLFSDAPWPPAEPWPSASLAVGVDALVLWSSADVGTSTIFTSPVLVAGTPEPSADCCAGSESSDAVLAPVFGRLCCFCVSPGVGERERLRVESASGMVKFQ